MLNLFDYLSEEDNKKIESYIQKYGVEDDYIGNEAYLKYWAESNKKLFHLLGGNLIYKVPFCYDKNREILSMELKSFRNRYINFLDKFTTHIFDFFRKHNYEHEVDQIKFDIIDIASTDNLVSDRIYYGIKFKKDNDAKVLQLQKGMKPMRAMQKAIKYFEFNDLEEEFEKFRIDHSLIYNEKHIKGNLCFSIHPLDFMTMSDNANDWSSCMSWITGGCYRIGTVEMMNSNNVICVYIESEHEKLTFGNYTWNSKKWRQLFYCTKEIIVSGKSYPYANETFTKGALEELRKLAKVNWNHTYSFGIEKYKDMIHINTMQRMDNNKIWARGRGNTKHNIIFDSKGMYNDMFNDSNRDYWCVRNKVKRNTVISYSGKTKCLCCNSHVLDERWDWDEYDLGYNDRYEHTNRLICPSCYDDRYCESCGNEDGYYKVYEINGRRLCSDCVQDYIKVCPDCGEPFSIDIPRDDKPVARIAEGEIFISDLGKVYDFEYDDNTCIAEYWCCPDCIEKNPRFTTLEVKYRPTAPSWYDHNRVFKINIINEIIDKNDPDLLKHSRDNLETFDFSKNF